VLQEDTGGIKVEVSFAGQRKLLGVDTVEVGTYELNDDGRGYPARQRAGAGEEQRRRRPDMDGRRCWKANRQRSGRQVAVRLDHANDVITLVAPERHPWGVGEWEVVENGNGKARLWEWK